MFATAHAVEALDVGEARQWIALQNALDYGLVAF
jgi:hypothetical protein